MARSLIFPPVSQYLQKSSTECTGERRLFSWLCHNHCTTSSPAPECACKSCCRELPPPSFGTLQECPSAICRRDYLCRSDKWWTRRQPDPIFAHSPPFPRCPTSLTSTPS